MRRAERDDRGATLVLALVFLMIFSLFLTATLTKTLSNTGSAIALRERGDVQYASDGGVDRAIQLLQRDLANGAAKHCVDATSGTESISDAPGNPDTALIINGKGVSYNCQTLAGQAPTGSSARNGGFAIIVTDSRADALTSSNAAGDKNPLVIKGSVFLNGPVSNDALKKKIEVTAGGNIMSPFSDSATRTCSLSALTQLYLDPGDTSPDRGLKECGLRPVSAAVLPVSLPLAPVVVSAKGQRALASGGSFVPYVVPEDKGKPPPKAAICNIYRPGKYVETPDLASGNDTGNYFISGSYYFDFPDDKRAQETFLVPNGAVVTAGEPYAGNAATTPRYLADMPPPSSACSGIDDSEAAAVLLAAADPTDVSLKTLLEALRVNPDTGARFVFGGTTNLRVGGILHMSTPSSDGTTPLKPAINVMAARPNRDAETTLESTDAAAGYAPRSLGIDVMLMAGTDANADMTLNGSIYAPSAGVSVFASRPTDIAVRRGIVAKRVDLAASAGADDVLISSPENEPVSLVQFRTVRIESWTDDNPLRNVAVVKLYNDAPYTAQVLSWRTQ